MGVAYGAPKTIAVVISKITSRRLPRVTHIAIVKEFEILREILKYDVEA